MRELKTKIIDSIGLHARPATIAVNAASKFKSEINILYNNRRVNMKSIMGVMSLGIPSQAQVVITCSGEDEEIALNSIKEILHLQKIIQ